MKITDCLNTEHWVFLSQLETLEAMLQEGAPVEALRAATLTIGAAVERHRAMEDEILYPAIRRQFGDDFPPILVMEGEHQEIESSLKGVASRAENMHALTQGFIDLLRQHIAKEMQVLFPMAEQAIPLSQLEHMACQCTERHQADASLACTPSPHPCGHGGHD